MEKFEFSIIVPAHNEEKHLPCCLNALRTIQYPREQFEIIVVDNGSSDRTADCARDLGADLVLSQPFGTVATARNFGYEKSSGSTLVFVDADCEVASDHLKRIAATLKNQQCVTGATVSLPLNSSWVATLWRDRPMKHNIKPGSPHYINAGNLAVPRNIFQKVGGFNPDLDTGEDFEFCIRAAEFVPIRETPNLQVLHHGEPQDLLSFLLQQIWHGSGALGALKLRSFDKPLIGTLVFAVFTVLQIVGFCMILQGGSTSLWIYSTAFIILLLYLSALVNGNLPKITSKIPQLLLIWYAYYLGRLISLFLLMTGKSIRLHR